MKWITSFRFQEFPQQIFQEIIAKKSEYINAEIVKSAKELMGEDMQIPLGASFGGVFVPDQGTDYEKLVQKADRALYIVKKNGKHGIAFFREGIAKKDDEEAVASVEELRRVCQVLEERTIKNSALWLDKESFAVAYRYMMRYIRSYKGSAYRALVTLEKKDVSMDPETFAMITEEFGKTIDQSLRKSDIMMQNRPNQFLLLLPKLEDEFAESVFARIRNIWKESEYFDKATIRFDADKVSGEEGPSEEKRKIR